VVAGNSKDDGNDPRDGETSDKTDWDSDHATPVNPDSDLDNGGNTSTYSEGDNDTDSDSGTDDDVSARPRPHRGFPFYAYH